MAGSTWDWLAIARCERAFTAREFGLDTSGRCSQSARSYDRLWLLLQVVCVVVSATPTWTIAWALGHPGVPTAVEAVRCGFECRC